jgi:thioredoxin 1
MFGLVRAKMILKRLVYISGLFALSLAVIAQAQSAEIRTVTDADFDSLVLKSNVPVIVHFYTETCVPCMKMTAPVLDRLAPTMIGKMTIMKLKVDENPKTADRYGINSIPTLLIFKNGEMHSRQVGVPPEAKLEAWMNANVAQ